MGKHSYPFHPDLKKYEKQTIPVRPMMVPILQKLMGVLYGMEASDEEVDVSRLTIPARDGHALRGLMYSPAGASEHGPCLLFLHGGGFVYNTAPHHFSLARRFTQELGWKTLLVDYRLAPKYRYPTATEDCYDTYCWILKNAESLGIDPDRIAVCGDSAGGNLSAVLCLVARDCGIPLPKAQMLLYPVTDRRMITDSVKLYTDTPMCNSRDMETYFKLYLKDGEIGNIPYLSPIEADSLEGLPDAYVEVAEFDCLRDEGLAYAAAMEQAGVPVQVHEVKGAMHGYDIAVGSSLVNDLMAQRIAFFQKTV